MKRLIIICFIFPFAVIAQKIDKETIFNYSEGVDFSIQRIVRPKTIDRSNLTIMAGKGRRFISMTFEFHNTTSEPQTIDFEKFLIEDKDNQLYNIDFVVMEKKVTISTRKFQQTLKPNSKRKIFVEFRPSFPKSELVEKLIIDGNTFQLKYK